MEKSCKKRAPKTSLRPLFDFAKQTKTTIAHRKFFQKYGILTENYQKALKKLSLFFLSKPVYFNGQSYKNQKGPGKSRQSLFKPRNKYASQFMTS